MRHSFLRIVAIAAVAAWNLGAQGEPPEATPTPAPAAPPSSLVFVPYDKMTGPKLGRDNSVLLPYAEFLKLRGSAQGSPESAEFRPSAAIAQATYTGKIEGMVAQIDAELTIEALARPKDWLDIALPFAGAPIASAAIEGQGAEGSAATLSPLEGSQGLGLRLRGEGRRIVRLKLAAPLKAVGAARRLEFGIPRAAAATIKLALAEDAALEPAADALPATIQSSNGAAEIAASCGSRDAIVIVYRPKAAASAMAAQARLAVEQSTALSVSPKTASLRSTFAFRLLSGEASSVEIAIPPGVRLLGVTGPFVRDWNVKDEGNLAATRAATVSLARAVGEPFELALEAQIETADSPERVAAPELRVAGAAKESGTITVAPDAGLDIWPEEMAGLESVPGSDANGAARAFRFAQPGWKLTLARRPVPARIRADGIILYEIADEFVRIATRHRLAISGRGIFGATFTIPEGYELREASPPELVSGFRQNGRKAEVNFRGEQAKLAEVTLRLQRKRAKDEPKLAIEPVAVEGAEEDAGSLAIAAPAALRVTETKSSGLQATDVRGMAERLQTLRSPDLNPALGYRYFTAGFSGEAAIEKQKASVTCDTTEMASISPALIRIDATLNYNVEFTAIDEFKLLVPAAAGENVRFNGEGIKEKIRDTLGATGDDGMTTWTIRLQSRVVGAYSLAASFDQPLKEAEPGKAMTAGVPLVRALGVARETGHLAVSRGENLEVRVSKSEGLEARDAKELPRSLAGAFLGFRYFDPKKASLELGLVRHELESVLGAVIRRMHTETVLSDQGEATHETTFEVQNNREQYLELRLPEGMEIWSAFVRGAPTRPTRNEKGALLIELAKSETMSQAFRVRIVLRQTMPGGALGMFGKIGFAPPVPTNIPVIRTTWKLYLPTKHRFLWFGGTMRQETGGSRSWIEPAAEALLNDLPASVAGGIAAPTLNPPVAQEGAGYNAAESDAERQARMAGAALDVPIVKIGQQFEFSKLSGVGDIQVRYWKAKPLVLVQGAFAILLFSGLLIAMARYRRLCIAFAAALAGLIGASLAEGFTGRMFATAFAVSTAALALGAIVSAMRKAKAMRNIVLESPHAPSSAGYDEDFAYAQSSMPLSPSHPAGGAGPAAAEDAKSEAAKPEAAEPAEAEAEPPTEAGDEEKPAKRKKRRARGPGEDDGVTSKG